jgi:aminoglycoside phosphotransferase (APT) family kinase protein
MSAMAAVLTARRDLLDVVSDANVRVAVLGASRDPNAKVTVLVMPQSATEERVAIKVPTTAIAGSAVAREMRTLNALHSLGSDVIRRTVPRPIDVVNHEGRDAMVVTLLPGTPLTTLYHRWRHTRSPKKVAQDLGAVSLWLRQLHDETAAAVTAADMDGGSVRRISERFADVADISSVVAFVDEACAALGAHSTPCTVVHGDLWCGNVLVTDGVVTGVVDWEEASLQGEPLRDLARFALAYALYLDRHTKARKPVAGHPGLIAGEWGIGIDYLLRGNGWICDLLRAFLRLGMRRLGVPGELWPQLLIAGIAEIAARADEHTFARAHIDVLRRHMEAVRGTSGER